MNFAEQNLTGKASIDKPWLNFYPEEFRNLDIPRITMESFLKMKNPDENRAAFEYFCFHMETRSHGNSFGQRLILPQEH